MKIDPYLNAFGTTRHGCKYIITVHSPKNEARAIPGLCTESATNRSPATTLKTAHAHC